MNTINRNLMAANVANNLNSHYGKLATSVERLSTGLRVNSAADDAAGLAIRELMRAEVAALNQGVRNANDAISMLQVADGALAVIDEKLIRMKELAEQAATGTYDSTQRLMIASEYQAMAAEIDRIARATEFNGIRLLDGSLSGAHNGRGLNASGAMKIHFGSANDSAEDYYYISIGGCTTAALGLGGASTSGGYTYIRFESVEERPLTFTPHLSFDEYIDPVTGNKYYTDGDFFFSSTYSPASTILDWETDREIIERLRLNPATATSQVYWTIYKDPAGNEYYYNSSFGYVSDPHDINGSRLDGKDPTDKAIMDSLVSESKSVDITTVWDVYEDASGKEYYTCDNGATFVPDVRRPLNNVLDSQIPADKAVIDTFSRVMGVREISAPTQSFRFEEWKDPVTGQVYWTRDGGKSFSTKTSDPDGTLLDPSLYQDIIDRLVVVPDNMNQMTWYDIYVLPSTGVEYYSRDGGITFITDVSRPDLIAFDGNIPADMAVIATFEPKTYWNSVLAYYDIYEDRANGNKRYYTDDNGATFFDDLADPAGSLLDKNAPGYASLIANFANTNSRAEVRKSYQEYFDPQTKKKYYTDDKGKTFIADMHNPKGSILTDSIILGRIEPHFAQTAYTVSYSRYRDPVTGEDYYTLRNGGGVIFVKDVYDFSAGLLDRNNPADEDTINRLTPVPYSTTGRVESTFPDKYLVYEDVRNGNLYYSPDDGKTFTSTPLEPYDSGYLLNPDNPAHKTIIDNLTPSVTRKYTVEYIRQPAIGATSVNAISTQEAAQQALVAIDRAIVSKDRIRAHLGALQNRLENTVANISIQSTSQQAAESRISDADIAAEMTQFVRNQILSQSAVAMLGQANSYPHMLMGLIGG